MDYPLEAPLEPDGKLIQIHHQELIRTQEAEQILAGGTDGFFGAVLDLVLPDAQDGEIVDLVLQHNLPVVVMTSTFSDDIRECCISKNIVDYIIKDSPSCMDYLCKMVKRLHKNQQTKLLVVDDSKMARHTITTLLERHRFIVLNAVNGLDALDVLEKNPETQLVITDYAMPEMDGFGLLSRIREKFPMDRLAVIGLSSLGGSVMSAKFLKLGANDFIVKPFSNEEFFWRINQNLEMLDYIASISKAAIRDFLTGLYNRRYFFEVGETLFKTAVRQKRSMVIAMLDIDHFKKINDVHGHAVGDRIICHIADIIQKFFRSSDVVARVGGKEFCVLAPDMTHINRLDELCRLIADSPLNVNDAPVRATVSIGVTALMGDTLEATIEMADQQLYKAKQGGRNRVCSTPLPDQAISQ